MNEAITRQNLLDWAQAVGADGATGLGASQDFVCGWKGADGASECGLIEGEHLDHARYLN